jgi:hypothetical protein
MLSLVFGFSLARAMLRTFFASSIHEPPRSTGKRPVTDRGLFTVLVLYVLSLNLSLHHSRTLPSMSYRPHPLGLFWPTGWVL